MYIVACDHFVERDLTVDDIQRIGARQVNDLDLGIADPVFA